MGASGCVLSATPVRFCVGQSSSSATFFFFLVCLYSLLNRRFGDAACDIVGKTFVCFC